MNILAVAISLFAGALVSCIIQLILEEIWRRRHRPESIHLRVRRLGKSLEEAVALLHGIESEIKDRAARAAKSLDNVTNQEPTLPAELPEVSAYSGPLGRVEPVTRTTMRFWKGVALNFAILILGAGVLLAAMMLSE